MNERNDKQHERYSRVRKRKTNRPIILILTGSVKYFSQNGLQTLV